MAEMVGTARMAPWIDRAALAPDKEGATLFA
jgi:hypothetical protein